MVICIVGRQHGLTTEWRVVAETLVFTVPSGLCAHSSSVSDPSPNLDLPPSRPISPPGRLLTWLDAIQGTACVRSLEACQCPRTLSILSARSGRESSPRRIGRIPALGRTCGGRCDASEPRGRGRASVEGLRRARPARSGELRAGTSLKLLCGVCTVGRSRSI